MSLKNKLILCFSLMNKASLDNQLTYTEFGVLSAIIFCWAKRDFHNPFQSSRKIIMATSKIGSVRTYHKCIKKLHFMGYICYYPSYNPITGSKIFINKIT